MKSKKKGTKKAFVKFLHNIPAMSERKSVVRYDKRQNKADNILLRPDKKVTRLDRNCSK